MSLSVCLPAFSSKQNEILSPKSLFAEQIKLPKKYGPVEIISLFSLTVDKNIKPKAVFRSVISPNDDERYFYDALDNYLSSVPQTESTYQEKELLDKIIELALEHKKTLTPMEHPTLTESLSIPVDMGTFAITSSTSEHPILYTAGLGPCISVALEGVSDSGERIIAMSHMSALTNTKKSLEKIANKMKSLGASKLKMRLVGGWKKYPELLSSLETSSQDLEIPIVDRKLHVFDGYNEVVAYDARNNLIFYEHGMKADKTRKLKSIKRVQPVIESDGHIVGAVQTLRNLWFKKSA